MRSFVSGASVNGVAGESPGTSQYLANENPPDARSCEARARHGSTSERRSPGNHEIDDGGMVATEAGHTRCNGWVFAGVGARGSDVASYSNRVDCHARMSTMKRLFVRLGCLAFVAASAAAAMAGCAV